MERLVGGLIMNIFDFFKHLCEDNSAGPNVDRLVVVRFKKYHFWRSVDSGGHMACQNSASILLAALNQAYSVRNFLFNLFQLIPVASGLFI